MKIRSNSELDPTERAADGRERGALERGGLPHELVVRGLEAVERRVERLAALQHVRERPVLPAVHVRVVEALRGEVPEDLS